MHFSITRLIMHIEPYEDAPPSVILRNHPANCSAISWRFPVSVASSRLLPAYPLVDPQPPTRLFQQKTTSNQKRACSASWPALAVWLTRSARVPLAWTRKKEADTGDRRHYCWYCHLHHQSHRMEVGARKLETCAYDSPLSLTLWMVQPLLLLPSPRLVATKPNLLLAAANSCRFRALRRCAEPGAPRPADPLHCPSARTNLTNPRLAK